MECLVRDHVFFFLSPGDVCTERTEQKPARIIFPEKENFHSVPESNHYCRLTTATHTYVRMAGKRMFFRMYVVLHPSLRILSASLLLWSTFYLDKETFFVG